MPAAAITESEERVNRIMRGLHLVWIMEEIFGHVPAKRPANPDDSLEFYRETQDDPEGELCRDCLHYPAQYAGRCWSCNAGRRIA